jgi:hypothetical protein
MTSAPSVAGSASPLEDGAPPDVSAPPELLMVTSGEEPPPIVVLLPDGSSDGEDGVGSLEGDDEEESWDCDCPACD